MARRRLCAAGSVALAALAAGCSAGPAAAPSGGGPIPLIGPTVLPTAAASPVPGRLLIVQGGNLAIFDLGTLRARPITSFPQGTYASSPALSHDGKQIAFTYYVPPTEQNDLGGNDLYVADASGPNPRLLRAHPESGATYENPCWTADDQGILATLRRPTSGAGQSTGESLAIVRVGLNGEGARPVLQDALGPAVSPDGKYLVYTAVNANGEPTGVRIANVDGQGGRELLANQGFAYVRSPCFSPDGSRIAFSAVGGPDVARPQGRLAWPILGPTVAEAHGIPWDIWSVRPDGGDVRRLTHESEDSPIPTWSPDGKWLAVAGEIGLYLIDAAGTKILRVSTLSSGGIAWLR